VRNDTVVPLEGTQCYEETVFGKLFLLFTALPLIDLYLLLRIGNAIGGVATLALVVVTGALGAMLARAEGMRVLRAFQDAVARGVMPRDGVLSGALLMLGGALLITPGVITDALGLLLLVPFTRRRVAALIAMRMQRAIERGSIRVVQTRFDPRGAQGPSRARFDDAIDTEGESVPPRAPDDTPKLR
jgi:UPF0716 protein FxsA